MKLYFLTAIFVIVFAFELHAQVTVTGANPSSNGTYSTLLSAFTNINANSQSGYKVLVNITGNTSESGTIPISAGAWDSLIIYPTASNVTISGAMTINLAGSNVIIDGRLDRTGSTALTLSNTSSSLVLLNITGSNNTIKHCNLKSTTRSAYTPPTTGSIYLNNCTNNIIEYNNITGIGDTDAGRPQVCIYSKGASASSPNTGTAIRSNNFYNFMTLYSTTVYNYGIRMDYYNGDYTITGNSFYETTNYAPATNANTFAVISIENATGTIRIDSNYIGGSQPQCGGNPFTNTSSDKYTSSVYGIYVGPQTSSSVSIYRNIIKNISWSGAGNFVGIFYYNPGGYNKNPQAANLNAVIRKNIIGDSAGTGSVSVTNFFNGYVYGIWGSLSGECIFTVDSNVIGSVETSNASTSGTSFYGVFVQGSATNAKTADISNNLIGSYTTPNSIYLKSASTSSSQYACGIYASFNNNTGYSLEKRITGNKIANIRNNITASNGNYTAGIYSSGEGTISGNTINDIFTASGNTNQTLSNSQTEFSLMGIISKSTENLADTVYILNNNVYNLLNSNSTFSGAISGITYCSGNGTSSIYPRVYVENNFINNLSVTGASSTSAIIMGTCNYAYQGYALLTYANNIISLGGNSTTGIYGHYNFLSGLFRYYFNTVYIGGSPSSGASSSQGIYCNSGAFDIRNNNFINVRSNSGTATGSHYAVNYYTSTALSSDYNNYIFSGTGGKLGRTNTDYATFNLWKALGYDINGSNTDPQFATAGGTQAVDYKTGIELRGTGTTGIKADYAGTERKIIPTIGSFEFIPVSFPVTVTATSGTLNAQYTRLDDAMFAVNKGLHKGDIEIKFSESHTLNGLSIVGTDKVGFVAVNNYGSGYNKSYPPTVTFSDPPSGGVKATGTAVVFAESVIGINITNRGAGYTAAPTVTISGTYGTGATATAILPEYTNVRIFPTVSGLQIGGAFAEPAFLFDAADNVTIDGRVNGTGSNKDLTIISSRRKYPAIKFINDASNNIVKYTTVKADRDSVANTGAPIEFLGGFVTGNDNNRIEYCDITRNALKNSYGIYSYGTSEAVRNSSNTVSNCSFYNLIDSASAYMCVSSFNESWTISGNSFYEPGSINNNGGNKYFLLIANKGGSYLINNNYFGGKAPNCSGGKLTFNNAFGSEAGFISLSADSVNASSIQGNVISNIDFSNFVSSSNIYGIKVLSSANIGTEAGNRIGDSTGTGSISLNVTNSSTAGFYGIYFNGNGLSNIQNNTIGSIRTSSSSTGTGSIYGIQLILISSNNVYIKNNLIGSRTEASSINASSASSTYQTVYGIYLNNSYSNSVVTVDSNTVSNIVNAGTSTQSNALNVTQGIKINTIDNYTNTSSYNVTNNTVSSISAANNNTYNSYFEGYILGIQCCNRLSTSVQTVSGNKVYNISNTNASFSGNIAGICTNFFSSSDYCVVERNFVNGLSVNTGSTGSTLYGMYNMSTKSNIVNNVISVDGNFPSKVFGMRSNSNDNLFFNTVYLNGTVSSGSSPSYALYSDNMNYCNQYNNVLANQRTNSGGTGKHYAIYSNSTAVYMYGMNYNDYYAPGSGGYVGYISGDKSTLADWKTAVGRDTNSLSTNPGFTGGSSIGGYYPGASLPGLAIAGYTTDYTGKTRGATPSIGALESSAISVTATSGKSSGFYNTLKESFDAVNSGLHKGYIDIKLNASTIETQTAVLNASGGTSNYFGINIYPTSSNLSVTGNIDGAPLIEFNGADYITFSGKLNYIGEPADLTVSNTSTSATAGTSVIRFVNDATNNSVQYCILKGSSMAPAASDGGIVSIYKTNGSTGNDYNSISYNKFTNAGGNRPLKGIYSEGSSGKDNDNNTFSYNEFGDIMNLASSDYSAGIFVYGGSTYYHVQGNSFYETSSYAPGGNADYYAIRVDNASGNYFRVLNNYIGGTEASCGGSMLTKTNANNNNFYGVYMNVGTSTQSILQINYINKVSWSNSGAANFYGVYALSGADSISQVYAGSSGETTPQITLTNGASGGAFYGVYSNTSGSRRVIQNNTIGAIKTDNNSLNSTDFYGIYAAGSGKYKLANNTIGSTVSANSILLSSASTGNPQLCYGVYAAFTGTENDSIYSNTIANMTNNTSNFYGYIHGIYYNGSTTASNIYSNFIYSLSSGSVNLSKKNKDGVKSEISPDKPEVNKLENRQVNRNPKLRGVPAGANICGLSLAGGNSLTYNNIINLGDNNSYALYGIADFGGTNDVYFNSVYLGGSPSTGMSSSYAFYSNSSSARNLKNNILYNARSNDGAASGTHYAIGVQNTTGLTINYNDYYGTGSGYVLAFINTSDVATLAELRTATGQDAKSLNVNPKFVLAAGTSAADYKTSDRTIVAATGTGITTDYNGAARDNNFPTMGAWESDTPLPVNLSSFTYSVNARNVALYWQTYSEVNNAGYYIERKSAEVSVDAWKNIGFIQGSGTTSVQKTYSFKDSKLETGRYSYRLKQVDYNGNFEYYNLSGEIEIVLPGKFELSQNYPNPFNPTTKIDFALPVDSKVTIAVYDITGREIARLLNNEFRKANYYTVEFNASNLSSGAYFYRIISDKFTMTKKMILLK